MRAVFFCFSIIVQLNITDEVRGRVMSVYMMTFGLMPLGALPAGSLGRVPGGTLPGNYGRFGACLIYATNGFLPFQREALGVRSSAN